ncbi:hypothetical protein PI124_g9372 [Phytophthora idaei]|nr:hypothetical protein PI125_g11983 [Phytophthora idaei]KAG3156973.1 hypothetical protein PI126_g8529 [Phytophthora idaei]KAG3245889.1 hypothetical protein PI124_g9372 [Phytophthora idaei]
MLFLFGEEEQEDAVYISQREEEIPELNLNLGWKKLCRKLKTRNQDRMELEGQPLQGWRVDLEKSTCPRRSWSKYGTCVHFLAAIRVAGRDIPGVPAPKRSFLNRRRSVSRGRPGSAGPALAMA